MFGEENRLTELEYIELDTLIKQTLPVNTLVFASGRFPELIFTKAKNEAETDASGDVSAETSEVVSTEASESADAPMKWEAIAPYKAPALKAQTGLFADGDVLSDYSAAIKAIGAGRRSAASIHQVMYGIDPSLTEKVLTPNSNVQDVDRVENVTSSSRQIMPLSSPKDLVIRGELEKGFNEAAAQVEADRCLQCGLVCYERPGMTSKLKELPVEAENKFKRLIPWQQRKG